MKTKYPLQYLIIICLLASTACQNHNRGVIKDISSVTGLSGVSQSGTTFLLIPSEGCSGCISDASGWAMEHIDDKNDLYVIFTRETDLKSLKIKIGEHFLSHQRVFVDTFGVLNYGSEASIYPQVVFVNEKGEVELFDFDVDRVNLMTVSN